MHVSEPRPQPARAITDLAAVVREGPERRREPRLRPRGLVATEAQEFGPRETGIDAAQNDVAEVAVREAAYEARRHRDAFLICRLVLLILVQSLTFAVIHVEGGSDSLYSLLMESGGTVLFRRVVESHGLCWASHSL